MATLPITGPHQFSTANTANTDQLQTQAMVFIAERMAGIEWLLFELNNKMLTIQQAVGQMNHKFRP